MKLSRLFDCCIRQDRERKHSNTWIELGIIRSKIGSKPLGVLERAPVDGQERRRRV